MSEHEKSSDSEKPDNVKKLRVGESQRLAPGSLDEHYIQAYEENPIAKKIDLLRRAIELAGIEHQATYQRAIEIHDRLSDELETRLLAKAKHARALGLKTLLELCEGASSESVRAQVATTLTKDIFPDHQVVKDVSYEELQAELEQIEREEKQQGLH